MKHHGRKEILLCLRIRNSEFGLVILDNARRGSLTDLSEGEEPPHFHPEFGRFMLEATPGKPWGIDFKDLLKVESNMKWR